MKSPLYKEVIQVYDIEISSDRYALEQAYRMECALESAYEAGRADAVLNALKQSVESILERQDAQLKALEQFKQDLGETTGGQTEEETRMFEEWLS